MVFGFFVFFLFFFFFRFFSRFFQMNFLKTENYCSEIQKHLPVLEEDCKLVRLQIPLFSEQDNFLLKRGLRIIF